VPRLVKGVGQHARRHDFIANPLFGPDENVPTGEVLPLPDRLGKGVEAHIGGRAFEPPRKCSPPLNEPAGGQQGLGAIVPGIHRIMCARNERVKRVQRFFGSSQFIEGRGQVEMDRGMFGFEPMGFLEMCQSVRAVAGPAVGIAEVVVKFQ